MLGDITGSGRSGGGGGGGGGAPGALSGKVWVRVQGFLGFRIQRLGLGAEGCAQVQIMAHDFLVDYLFITVGRVGAAPAASECERVVRAITGLRARSRLR